MTKTRIIAAIGVSCAALFAAGAHAQTMRKNEFYFSTPLLIQPFHFTLKEYRVTQGQPYGGVSDSIDTAKHYASIYVLAGRKKSEPVADWFFREIAIGEALGSGVKVGRMPAELNFAIKGDLTIAAGDTQLFCKDVVLAQGHSGPFNNWWVGGPHMKYTEESKRTLLVQTCDGGIAKIAVGGVG